MLKHDAMQGGTFKNMYLEKWLNNKLVSKEVEEKVK